MIEVIRDRETWEKLLLRANFQDFYFTYDYHHLSSSASQTPVLIHFFQGSDGILFPLLLREIEGTTYMDVTSVYGYAGPVIYGDFRKINYEEFRDKLIYVFEKLKIVSAFARLHPYIDYQKSLLNRLGDVQKLGRVVNIDLRLPPSEQWSHISSRNRTYINKAKRDYRIRSAISLKDVEIFAKLYYQTMQRLNAHPKYFFTNEYFKNLWESKSFKTNILLAENADNRIVSGAMFISCGEIIHYHLSGTDKDYLKLHPVKVLINEMRNIGSDRGYGIFNLGGGLGGSEDSLFHFKTKFSRDYRDFSIWKFIVNKELYIELSQAHLKNKCIGSPVLDHTFFPSYRLEKRLPEV